MRHTNLNQFQAFMSPRFLQELLSTVDDIQVAAMVGHLDANGAEALNVLTDIHHTLAEAISELEYRLLQGLLN